MQKLKRKNYQEKDYCFFILQQNQRQKILNDNWKKNALHPKFQFTDYRALKNQYEKQAKTRKRLFIDLSYVYIAVQNILAV